jgi:hypothetical protein
MGYEQKLQWRKDTGIIETAETERGIDLNQQYDAPKVLELIKKTAN